MLPEVIKMVSPVVQLVPTPAPTLLVGDHTVTPESLPAMVESNRVTKLVTFDREFMSDNRIIRLAVACSSMGRPAVSNAAVALASVVMSRSPSMT